MRLQKISQIFTTFVCKDNICGKMYSVHDTFFDEVRHEGYETVMPCDEVAVFCTKAGMGTGYKVTHMLSNSFSIMPVKSGTARQMIWVKYDIKPA